MKKPYSRGNKRGKLPVITKTISLQPDLLELALERALSQNRDFSNYVQTLIKQDVNGKSLAAA